MSDTPSCHDGHRERMRERFLHSEPDSFAVHELIEMLLFYAIPRRDTNEIAHRLIEEFGSLGGLLEADRDSLTMVDGVREQTAIFLRLVGEIARRYAAEKMCPAPARAVYDSADKVAAYMAGRYMGLNCERIYLLLFDNAMHLLDCFHVCDGSVDNAITDLRRIAERAYRKNATSVILTHNHPHGKALPSGDDLIFTHRLHDALSLLGIDLLDHFIFAENEYATICHYYSTMETRAIDEGTAPPRRKSR